MISIDDAACLAAPELRRQWMRLWRRWPEERLAGSVTVRVDGSLDAFVATLGSVLEGLHHARDARTDRAGLELATMRGGPEELPTAILIPVWRWHVRMVDVTPHLRLLA